ncbi:MAG: hypothetical protein ABWX92_11440, partial [Mycetocola sp.]
MLPRHQATIPTGSTRGGRRRVRRFGHDEGTHTSTKGSHLMSITDFRLKQYVDPFTRVEGGRVLV